MRIPTLRALLILFVAGFVAGGLAGCELVLPVSPPPPGERVGETEPLGDGEVRSWVRVNASGTPTAIGVTIDESALENLPETMTELTLALPAAAAGTPFDHVAVDWGPAGHEPEGVYDVPHFDVHFYTISEAERAAIVPGPDTVAVDPSLVPPDYVNGQIAVPMMGVHWIDVTSPELGGAPFENTFIYGFYRGGLTFMEPMVTKAYLESRPDDTRPIKQPERFAEASRYPTQYTVRYDAAQQAYVIALEGLTMRE